MQGLQRPLVLLVLGVNFKFNPTNMAEVIKGKSYYFFASCHSAEICCGSSWHRSPSMSSPMMCLSNWLQPGTLAIFLPHAIWPRYAVDPCGMGVQACLALWCSFQTGFNQVLMHSNSAQSTCLEVYSELLPATSQDLKLSRYPFRHALRQTFCPG